MFKETLKNLVEGTDGGVACLIMDATGIALESHTKDGTPFDINTVGIEFSVVLGSVKRAAQMLEAGETKEVVIATEHLVTLIRCINDAYFIAFTLKPDGNLGKARYLLRASQASLLAELG
jgi:predicted regulator of Ras-like GTPase activity (Roadblock/LC7/MglB family)